MLDAVFETAIKTFPNGLFASCQRGWRMLGDHQRKSTRASHQLICRDNLAHESESMRFLS